MMRYTGQGGPSPVWGYFFGLLVVLFAVFLIYVDLVALLAWFGEISHTGWADPSAVKIYVLVVVILAVLYLVGYWMWSYFANVKAASSVLWMYFLMIVIFTFLTIWAFLWDSRHGGNDIGDIFSATGGSPVISTVADDPDRLLLEAFKNWLAVQVAILGGTTLILVLMAAAYGVARTASQAGSVNARTIKSRPRGPNELRKNSRGRALV